MFFFFVYLVFLYNFIIFCINFLMDEDDKELVVLLILFFLEFVFLLLCDLFLMEMLEVFFEILDDMCCVGELLVFWLEKFLVFFFIIVFCFSVEYFCICG